MANFEIFKKEGFSVATWIVQRCSIYFLKHILYQTYRKPSLPFCAPPSLWDTLARLMFLARDPRAIDSWYDTWSSFCSRLDNAP